MDSIRLRGRAVVRHAAKNDCSGPHRYSSWNSDAAAQMVDMCERPRFSLKQLRTRSVAVRKRKVPVIVPVL